MKISREFDKLLDSVVNKHRQYIFENLMQGFQLLES